MGNIRLKQPISYTQQKEKLRSRGCEIHDDQECEKILSLVNYYRLSAYFLPFRQPDNRYVAGTTLSAVYRIYEFDREMRHLLFGVIEEVEVCLRTRFAYFHAHKYGADGYRDPTAFNDHHDHQEFLNRIKAEIKANAKLPFVRHHNESYAGNFPIWVIVELFTFGMLSYFFADMKTQDQKDIAKPIWGATDRQLRSWLRCCTDLRNICAHYGRLYFRKFSARPQLPSEIHMGVGRQSSLFGALFALRGLYPDKVKWDKEVVPQIANLLVRYADAIDLNHIGFTDNWEQALCNKSSSN